MARLGLDIALETGGRIIVGFLHSMYDEEKRRNGNGDVASDWIKYY